MPSSSPASILGLGTRGGDLALRQAQVVARLITAAHPDVAVDIKVIRTSGDHLPSMPVAEIGGTGVFTRELERALQDGGVDLAVHSLKDLPTRVAGGLTLAAILERADPRDALVAPPGTRLANLPPGARIGTSSLRRRAQLLAQQPQMLVLDMRGNVPTRLEKLDRGECDALVLAHAGLLRLGLGHRVSEIIDPDVMVPAPGQGALAVEARSDDDRALALLRALDHRPTRLSTRAERAFLAALEGGCHAPVGALGVWTDDVMTLTGVVTSPRGDRTVRGRSGAVVRTEADADAAGVRLAEHLILRGAAGILAELRRHECGDGEKNREAT